MSNRFILLLPSYCIGPDGTILWPYVMNCGCKLEKFIQQKEGATKEKHDYFQVLATACTEHYRTICVNAGSAKPEKFYDFEGDLLPTGTTDDLNG